ncbi:right-handed parallel beta-helix repeat-containing protein, partial [Enterococcus faecalis]|nr:right-handed parallel beta-helix repeat-containing protein [Enterococcus faecalis]
GIYFISELPDNEEKTGIPKYDNIIIKGNRIKNVSRTGLVVAYSAYFDLFQNSAEIDQELIEKYGNTNVLIENNYIEDAGGDGIVTMYCSSPIIQRNVSDGAGRQMNTTDYPIATQRVAAAMWPWKCKNALFQYNEAYCTKNADQGNGDGQAWDADSADGTIYQYNYSSGNSGGTVMFCLENAVNSTFRFNISQNDKKGI